MKSTLKAMQQQLQWQKYELVQSLNTLEKKLQTLAEEDTALAMQIDTAYESPVLINPDIEINRLRFITQLHKQRDAIKQRQQEGQEQLNAQQQRLKKTNTELKMLEIYLKRTLKAEQQLQQNHEEQHLDEWAGQQGAKA